MQDGLEIQLTERECLLLESIKTILDGLADYLGDNYEFVLHSLESLDHSVVKIINGFHTSRKIGAPITNLALSMLEHINNNGARDYTTYFSKNKKGDPLKASTIAIRGDNNRIIGLLCINFHPKTPLVSVLENLFDNLMTPSSESFDMFEDEYFAEDTEEIILKTAEKTRLEVENNTSIPTTLKNKHIIMMLCDQGVFKIKDSVNTIANFLQISRNTVYLHLRAVKKERKIT